MRGKGIRIVEEGIIDESDFDLSCQILCLNRRSREELEVMMVIETNTLLVWFKFGRQGNCNMTPPTLTVGTVLDQSTKGRHKISGTSLSSCRYLPEAVALGYVGKQELRLFACHPATKEFSGWWQLWQQSCGCVVERLCCCARLDEVLLGGYGS